MRGVWPLWLLLMMTAPALGQQVIAGPSISTVELAVPRARQGVWNQMFGKAINPGSTELTGVAVYPAEDPKLGIVRYGRNIWLPPHSESTFWLTIRPGMLIGEKPSAKSEFSVAKQSGELVDARTGRLLDRKGDLRFIQQNANVKLICYVDDTFIAGVPDTAYSYLKDAESQLYTAATATMGRLPDQWYGYLGVNVLLLGSLDPGVHARRPSQEQALLDWVSQGGVLVLFETDNMPSTLAGPLGRAARVSCAGIDGVRELAVRSADGKFKADVTLKDPTPYASLVPDGADVICRANGLPLLTRARFGQGHVFALATPVGTLGEKFPNPADANTELSPLHGVWQSVGEAMVFAPAIRTEPFTDPLRLEGPKGGEDANLVPAKLAAISGRRGTDRGVVLMWLGGFLLLTTGLGLAMRLIRFGERTWLFMLPVALILSLGIYVFAETRKVNPSLSYVGLAVSSGDGRAMVYQATGYYSPSEFVTTASAGSAQGWLLPFSMKASPLDKTDLRRAAGMIWPDMNIRPNSAKTFLTGAAVDFPGVDVKVGFGPQGLSGALTNRIGQDLSYAVLMVRGRAFAVGALPAGKAIEVNLGAEQRLGEHSYVPVGFMQAEDRWRNELIAGLTESKSIATGGLVDDEPYLLGWVERPLLLPGEKMTAAPNKGLMLVAQRITYSPTPSGTAVLIPDEMLTKDYRPVGMSVWTRKGGFISSPRAGGVEMHAAAPDSVGRLTAVKATVQVVLHASGWRLNVQGIRPDGSLQPLEAFENPMGPKTIQIDGADAFMADGVLRIRIAVESLAGGPVRAAPTAGSNQWKFDDIDVTLQGTVQ